MPTLGTLLSDLNLKHDLEEIDCTLALSSETDTVIKTCLARTRSVEASKASINDGLSGPQIELYAPINEINRGLLMVAKDDISKIDDPALIRVFNHETDQHTSLVIRFNSPCPFTGDGKPFVGL